MSTAAAAVVPAAAPARSLPVRPLETQTLVSSNHVRDLMAENRALRRDLASANAARDNLFKQLNYAVAAGKVKDTLVVDGKLTAILTTGRVQQLQTKAITAPGEAGYRAEWVELPAVPGTAAAFRDRALLEEGDTLPFGMACVAGDEEMAS